jgi:hypothetical protein
MARLPGAGDSRRSRARAAVLIPALAVFFLAIAFLLAQGANAGSPTGTLPNETLTPSQTGTPTAISTVTRTPTRVPTTTCCHASGTVTTACALGTYEYDVALTNPYPNCGLWLNGPVNVYFEVSDQSDPSGTWTQLDNYFAGNVVLPPLQTVHVQGSFHEPSIPPPYAYYRIKWTMSYANCSGQHTIEGYSTPAALCPGATFTPTPIVTGSPTYTPTPSATATGTPSRTATYPVATTTCCGPSGTVTTTCSLADNYDYDVALIQPNPYCGLSYFGPLNVYFEVSGGGGWTQLDHAFAGNVFLPPMTWVHKLGSFYEPSIPPPYTYYRIRWTLTYVNCLGEQTIIGYSAPAALCPGPTSTPTASPTACPIQFTDVTVDSPFYPYVRCLACRGVVSGYPDGTFKPANNITRGQIAKVVSNAAGFQDDVTGMQSYSDVPPSQTFWLWIERLTLHQVMSGYQCGHDPSEPCDPQQRPYFRPGNNATRGQLTKIVSNAAGFSDDVTGRQTFQDVPPDSTFHLYVERLLLNRPGVMSGYLCGGSGEPCVPPSNRPYFRPQNYVTRGQASKMVANTFFPDCETPARR